MIYLLCFTGSSLLTAVAERQRKRRWLVLFSVLTVLLPCLLAGLRSVDVGRDVSHYIEPMVNAAIRADDLSTYYQANWKFADGTVYLTDFEYGFSILVYIVTRLTGSIQAVLFVISVLIMVPIYIALMRNRGKLPVWLGMLIFYLLFYNSTLDLMRQWIAIALLLLAFQMFCEKKYIPVMVFSLITLLFHYSSVIILLIICVYGFLRFFRDVEYSTHIKGKTYSLSGQTVAGILLALLALLVVMHADKAFLMLSKLGIDRFKDYLNGEKPYFVAREFFIRLPMLLLFVLCWKRFSAHTPMAPFYLTMLLLDASVSQLTSINPYAYRIPLFFSVFTVFSFPQIYASLKTKTQKGVVTGIALFYMLSRWGYLHNVLLQHHTYPYRWFLS